LHKIKNFSAVICRKLLKESFLASITHFWQELAASPGQNSPVAGKEI
jgi:hypothetical protein